MPQASINALSSEGHEATGHDAKVWLIDLDGTLYWPQGVKWAMGIELLLFGWWRIPVLRAFRRAHEEIRDELREDPSLQFSPHPFGEQLIRAAQKTGVQPEIVERTVMNWMVMRPGKWLHLFRRRRLIKRILRFRARGGLTAIVSDYPARAKLEALRMAPHFECVVASGEHMELRRLKPCGDGFLLAAQALGASPTECLVIGDRPDADGKAAENAGMKFEWIR